MDVGVALPQADGAGPGGRLGWPAVVGWAQEAERLGFASVWVADPEPGHSTFVYDPLVALGALARRTERIGLGTLALRAGRRPPKLLVRQVGTLQGLVGGRRLAVAVGGDGLEAALGALGDGPAELWAHGAGDDVVDLVARTPAVTGWSVAGRWAPDDYAGRAAALERACDRHGRDPATVTRALGLPVLVGEDGADLERRRRRLRGADSPAEATAGMLVGTVDPVRERLAHWRTLGVSQFIAGLGAIPFSAGDPGDLQLVASAFL